MYKNLAVFIILLNGFFFSINAQQNYPKIIDLYVIENNNPEFFGQNWPENTHQNFAYKRDSAVAKTYSDKYGPIPVLYENCPYTLRLTFDQPVHPDSVVYVWCKAYPSPPDFPNDIEDNISLVKEKFLIPKGKKTMDIVFQTSRVADELNENGFFAVEIWKNQQLDEYLPFICINQVDYDIKFTRSTVMHKGTLKVDIKDYSGYALYSLNNGNSWKSPMDSIYDYEIKNLEEEDFVYIKDPRTCKFIQISFAEIEVPPIALRRVHLPHTTNAIFNKNSGTHYIESMKDFEFTIQPTGENTGKMPVITTDRTSIPDSEGVKIVDNGDGTFFVTILRVQQDIYINLDFATGNDMIGSDNNIWTGKNQLYIKADKTGDATIYNAAGALIKMVPLIAGETANVSLSAGFYLVTINNKTHKVILE